MGRLVWFAPPLLASGFGAPAALVIVGVAAVLGGVFWLGRVSAKSDPEPSGG